MIVLGMWNQGTQNQCSLLDLSQYGWTVSGDSMQIDWDSDENIQNVQEQVKLPL